MNKEITPNMYYYLGQVYAVKKINMGLFAVMNKSTKAIQSVWHSPKEAIAITKTLDKWPYRI